MSRFDRQGTATFCKEAAKSPFFSTLLPNYIILKNMLIFNFLFLYCTRKEGVHGRGLIVAVTLVNVPIK